MGLDRAQTSNIPEKPVLLSKSWFSSYTWMEKEKYNASYYCKTLSWKIEGTKKQLTNEIVKDVVEILRKRFEGLTGASLLV